MLKLTPLFQESVTSAIEAPSHNVSTPVVSVYNPAINAYRLPREPVGSRANEMAE
jgi:hypothetical protein